MVLNIKKYPEPILRQKALEVTNIDESILRLIDDMIETMLQAPGVGLAAPQVGISKRVIVVDLSGGSEDRNIQCFINPEIIDAFGSETGEEGCLSLPGEFAYVKRASNIVLRALDGKGIESKLELEGLPARIVQHEVDHLDGILFIDRLAIFKRETIKNISRKE